MASSDGSTGSRIILAVSGGPDSLAMLQAAATVRSRIRSHVVTIDHGLRPESAAEARFVASVAARFGLSHSTLRWNGDKPSGNRQGRARDARYRLLIEAARDFGAVAVVTAHHQDDQIETHLLAQERNAGDRGLAGMRPARELAPGIHLLRPFLHVPGAALKASVAGLNPIDDPSNRDSRYGRVRFRRALVAGEIDRAAVLRDIARHSARRDEADARLADVIGDLRGSGRLVVDATGALGLDAASLAELDGLVSVDLLQRILPAVGGMDYPPLRSATERLLTHLLAKPTGENRRAHTLGGVSVEIGRRISFVREFGRVGPAPVQLGPKARHAVFDGRFDLAWDPLPGAATLVPFGMLGRGNPAARCLPVLLDAGGAPLAAHAALLPKLGRNIRPLGSAERVTWRLCADLPLSRESENHGILVGADPSH